VFAWQPSQRHGIPREVIEHHMKIYPDVRLVQRKPQKQSVEGQNFICEKLKKLLNAGFIREVHHPRWLVNPVVIPMAGGKLGMCIDYTSLNKTCPEDPFSLPQIDQIMNSTSGYDLLCFLDAYSSVHKISLFREDEEHTTFITVDDYFCYVSMPNGLKNALSTFLHAMHKTFSNLIRDLVEVYGDDIIIKIKSHSSLPNNLAIVFDRLHSIHTMLNSDRCVFEVSAGKLQWLPSFAPGN
jgi:hypothetical protein